MAADITAIGRGHFMPAVLLRDPLFEQALMTRSMLALVSYLLGESCMLSSSSAMLKVRAPENLELHSDQVGQPSPFPPYAQVANATWALSDYSDENGATRFVPGSHRLSRHPTTEEALDTSLAVTVWAPAGSIVIWHGNTWHGAAPRTRPGARLSLIFLFCRWYLMPQMMHRQLASAEMLARNGRRFSTLMGKSSPYSGMEADGAPIDFTLGQASQFA
jgi:ectoine hydroxylase-related dioxygenase (phytanoyl-CoA dioxygenase family)